MPIRKEVEAFVKLGQLPAEEAPEATIAAHEAALQKIKPPISNDEAVALIDCFGPDDCHGLAWTLLHLVESAPGGSPLSKEPPQDSSEWNLRLWRRSNKE